MVKKLLTLLFMSVLAFSLSMAVFAQEASKEEAKEAPAQAKAEKTHQEHGSKNVVYIDPSQVKDNDRVICLGTYDQKGTFHATLISKRAPK